MKFCHIVDSLYPHMLTNFGQFILIFNKMALISKEVLIIFTALHGMQTRSSDENSVCLSVRPSRA